MILMHSYIFAFQVKFNKNHLVYIITINNKRLYGAYAIVVNKETLLIVCSVFFFSCIVLACGVCKVFSTSD